MIELLNIYHLNYWQRLISGEMRFYAGCLPVIIVHYTLYILIEPAFCSWI